MRTEQYIKRRRSAPAEVTAASPSSFSSTASATLLLPFPWAA